MSDFWVGNFRVDVARAQIIVKDDIISLEPRVLKVLLTLAKTPGEVVTHETLLENVWPNVVVAPNAVQRCIGQLRKALGDDAKQQKVIATHPKVGYSLVAKVEWPNTDEIKPDPSQSLTQQIKQSTYRSNPFKMPLPLNILIFSLCLLIMFVYLLPTESPSSSFNLLTPITSTDEKEYYPNFSPDGRYLVFNRYINLCENELWVKDLDENSEFKLTKNSGFYGPAAWSPDGNQLAFSSTGGCDAQPPIKRCRSISAVSFLLAKTQPQITRELLKCEQHNYGAVNWLTNDKIVFIDSYARTNEVKSLSLKSGLIQLLYADKAYRPQALIYSIRNKLLAITVHNETQNTSLIVLDTNTNTTRHVQLQVPDEFSDYLWWDPSWHPLKDTLITSAENSIFEIDLNGAFTEHSIPTVTDIYNPMYHPDGNKIVAVMGIVDLDIIEYNFHLTTSPENNLIKTDQFQTIHHSTVEDYQAKYQPKTANISFISARSGEDQIWFSQRNQLEQLSHFNKNTRINSYVWSLDGQSLALATKGELQLLTLDGQAQLISTPFKVIDVYQWINSQQVLLSIIKQTPTEQNQQRQIILFNINTNEYESIYQGFSHWAQLDDNQSLYYTGWDKTLHLFQDEQSILFPATMGMELSSDFILKHDQLVLMSEGKTWLYQLDNKKLSNIKTSTNLKRIANLSDINFTTKRLLFSVYNEARKDLVMFQP